MITGIVHDFEPIIPLQSGLMLWQKLSIAAYPEHYAKAISSRSDYYF